jgi:tol-pal system protein YbgF
MKKLPILLVIGITFISCVKKEEVNALEKQILDIKKELKHIKQQQTQLKQDTQDLAHRLDELSNIVSKNSIEIEKLKTSYKPPSNPPLEGEELVKTPQTPEEVYNQALDFYYQGRFEEAEHIFKKFLEDFKESHLYDNAMFWIGQIYYSKGEYEKAVKEFSKLVSLCEEGKLKDCNKEPITLLKLAYAYIKLNKKEDAKKVLEKLINKYPKSEEALVAKRKLRGL